MSRPNRFNKEILKHRRRLLRQNQTRQEKALWEALSNRQMLGVKFRRQHSIDFMILDFYSPQLKFAIELDGRHHQQEHYLKHDKFRDEYLMDEFGIHVLRIPNSAVDNDLDDVLRMIKQVITEILD